MYVKALAFRELISHERRSFFRREVSKFLGARASVDLPLKKRYCRTILPSIFMDATHSNILLDPTSFRGTRVVCFIYFTSESRIQSFLMEVKSPPWSTIDDPRAYFLFMSTQRCEYNCSISTGNGGIIEDCVPIKRLERLPKA